MPTRTVFFDTSFVLALENKDDPHHERAKLLDKELLNQHATLLLHWGILLEIADGYARISRRARGLQLIAQVESEDGYQISPLNDFLVREGLNLYRSRTDKDWGLTDCISFVLMKQNGVMEAATADIHFKQAGFKALLLAE